MAGKRMKLKVVICCKHHLCITTAKELFIFKEEMWNFHLSHSSGLPALMPLLIWPSRHIPNGISSVVGLQCKHKT